MIRLYEKSAGQHLGRALPDHPPRAHRTTGFFKIRGVNINHAEFEDLMFRQSAVNDFQAVLQTDPATGREEINILIEIARGLDSAAICAHVASHVKTTFEVSLRVEVLPLGTLAAEFECSVKAPRFVDRRE